ncbi:MAG TPA: hypothetical protein VGD60_01215 [Candidatus Acidoferrales bacterium]
MRRRFISSTSNPFTPKRPPQNLPDDFASFIPTSGPRRYGVPPPPAPPVPAIIPPSAQPGVLDPTETLAAPLENHAISHQAVPDRSDRPVVDSNISQASPSSPEDDFPEQLEAPAPAESSPADSEPATVSPLCEELGRQMIELMKSKGSMFDPRRHANTAVHQLMEAFSSSGEPAPPPQARNFSLADMPFMDPSFRSLSECSSQETTAIREAFLESRPAPKFRRLRARKNGSASPRAELQRHERKCAICNHPDREMIEFYFIRWHRPKDIAHDFGLPHVAAIYRHAQAVGLFGPRSRNLRAMLEHMFEKATCVFPTPDSLVRACRTYASLNEDGQWVEPATTHQIVGPQNQNHVAAAPRVRGSQARPATDLLASSALDLPPALDLAPAESENAPPQLHSEISNRKVNY